MRNFPTYRQQKKKRILTPRGEEGSRSTYSGDICKETKEIEALGDQR